MKRITFLSLALGAALTSVASAARGAVDVVTSIPELAAITEDVGGNLVTVYSVARPNRDYHRVEPRPSDVARISNSDLVIVNGLGLDPWMDTLSRTAGTPQINRGGANFVDASQGVPAIEVPTEQITGASGDVHPQGNPHYLLDPTYGAFAARNITRALIRVDARNAQTYRANYARFRAEALRRTAAARRELAPYAGRPVVTYHRNFNYLLRRFGLRQYGTLEPRPGIPPSGRHINTLLQGMKRDNVKAMLIESIYPRRYPDLMARQLGVRYFIGPFSASSTNAGAYFNWVDRNVDALRQALSQ